MLVIFVSAALSALYPAVKLLRYASISELKSKVSGKLTVQSVLVVSQFTFSIAIVLLTLLFSKQIQYVKNRDIGFSHQNTIVVSNTGRFAKKGEVLINQLRSKIPALEAIGAANFIHGDNTNQDSFRKVTTQEDIWHSLPHIRVTSDYFHALEMDVRFKSDKIPVTNNNTRFVVL